MRSHSAETKRPDWKILTDVGSLCDRTSDLDISNFPESSNFGRAASDWKTWDLGIHGDGMMM